MVWKAQIEENGFLDPDPCRASPVLQKQVGAGPVQYSDGILNPFLMGMGLPGV